MFDEIDSADLNYLGVTPRGARHWQKYTLQYQYRQTNKHRQNVNVSFKHTELFCTAEICSYYSD